MLGNLLFSLVGISAMKAVGDIGVSAVAAVVAGERVLLLIQSALFLIVGGTATHVAQSWGADSKEEVSSIVKTSLTLSILTSLGIVSFAFLFITEIVSLFDLHESIRGDTETYVLTICVFTIFLAIARTIATALRSIGDAIRPVVIMSIINLATIPVVFAFVQGYWGLPIMGLSGAAVAVGLSHIFASFAFYWVWQAGRTEIPARGGQYWDFSLAIKLIKTGYPVAGEQTLFHLGSLIVMIFVGFYGESAMAAYGIGVALMAMAYIVGFGFSTAATTLVGQAMGVTDPLLARQYTLVICLLSVVTMFFLGLLFLQFAAEIAAFFVEDEVTIASFRTFSVLLLFTLPLMAIEFSLVGALRGAGDTLSTLAVSSLSLVSARLLYPALCIALGLSVEWVYAVVVIDYGLKAVLYVGKYFEYASLSGKQTT